MSLWNTPASPPWRPFPDGGPSFVRLLAELRAADPTSEHLHVLIAEERAEADRPPLASLWYTRVAALPLPGRLRSARSPSSEVCWMSMPTVARTACPAPRNALSAGKMCCMPDARTHATARSSEVQVSDSNSAFRSLPNRCP